MGFFMSGNPSYVVRQSCGYCYRQVVPPDLRKLVGRTEIRYNLYTGSLRDAKSRARMINGRVHELFMKLERKAYGMVENQLTETKINKILRNIITETIKSAELARATSKKHRDPDDVDDVDDELNIIDTLRSEMREALALGDHRIISLHSSITVELNSYLFRGRPGLRLLSGNSL
jgi:hypothetical protein